MIANQRARRQSENHGKKVSNSFNGLGTRHTGGHSVIRKNGHAVPPVYKVNGNGPIKNGSNGLTDSVPASPCRTPTRRSITESLRFSRESRDSQYAGNGKGQNKISESDRCTDRHLNMVILFFVLGVVICWVPYHIFQLLVSASVSIKDSRIRLDPGRDIPRQSWDSLIRSLVRYIFDSTVKSMAFE